MIIPFLVIIGFFLTIHYLITKKKFIWIFIIFVTSITIFVIYNHYFNCGEVTGVFIEGGTQDYGELCGQYPETYLILHNYSIDRIQCFNQGSRFFFNNFYPDVDKLVSGHIYRFEYSKGGRSADSDASRWITEYYIESISEIK